MTTYIYRRLIQAFIVIILTTMILFLITRLMPGDPILLYISQDEYTRITSLEEIQALKHQFGLDAPLMVQYARWIGGVLHGDLGKSIFWGTTVWQELKRALPVSLFVGFGAWIFSHTIGIILGIITAVRRGRWEDTLLTTLANLGITIPNFWAGILLIYLFGLHLGWFPIQGWVPPWKDFWGCIYHMILPWMCIAVFPMGGGIRQTRSSILEVIRQDYVRTAWAKGLSERRVIFFHVLKNGLIPVITLTGMSVPQIFGGQVLIETVFNIPGMGRLATDAVFAQDYSIMQGLSLMMCTLVVLTNLLVDISYGWLDPRVRYS